MPSRASTRLATDYFFFAAAVFFAGAAFFAAAFGAAFLAAAGFLAASFFGAAFLAAGAFLAVVVDFFVVVFLAVAITETPPFNPQQRNRKKSQSVASSLWTRRSIQVV